MESLSDLTTETALMLFGIGLLNRFLSQIRWEPVKLTKEVRETNLKKEPIIIQTLKTTKGNQRVQTEVANTTSTKLQQMELR
jgi:hypothetical protein